MVFPWVFPWFSPTFLTPVAHRLPPRSDPGHGQRRVEGDHVGVGVVKEGQGEGPRGPSAVCDGKILEKPTKWGPPVRSWFINPINYSYRYHKP